ncbi:MAG: hypothetical protein E7321_06225 [Clostridiales bacterium]|nr:hypothetical protein [Clostridiales bacterium]
MHRTGDVSAPPQEDFLRRCGASCRAQKPGGRLFFILCWKAARVSLSKKRLRRGRQCHKKTDGSDASGNKNESFYPKNGRKQGISRAEFFAIAFARPLVYCIMVAGRAGMPPAFDRHTR